MKNKQHIILSIIFLPLGGYKYLRPNTFTIFFLIFYLLSFSHCLAAPESKVLVISSYHQGYLATDRLIGGIKRRFLQSDHDVDLYIEYLDTKRFMLSETSDELKGIFKEKYNKQRQRVDIIIVADNNALTFLNSIRQEVFPDIPIVFCGINNYQPGLIEGLSPITGVIEEISLLETVQLAQSLHKNMTHIAVITDSTVTGAANLAKFKEIEEKLTDSLQILYLTDLSSEELVKQLKVLPEHAIILQLSFYSDAKGESFSQKAQAKLLTANTDKPIYSAWDFFIEYGVLGGVVTFFPFQGEEAAKMALRIINGESIHSIPILTASPNIPVLDYRVMEKYGLQISDIPEESIVRNPPSSFYDENRTLVWGILFFLFSQSAFLLTIFLLWRSSERKNKLLQASDKRFELALNAGKDGLWDWDIPSGKVFYSDGYASMLGYKMEEIAPHITAWSELVHPDDREKALHKNQECIDNLTENFQVQFRMQHKNGNWIWILGRGMAFERDADGKAKRMVGTHADITKYKRLLEALRDKEKKLRMSEERYRTMIESLIDPVAICDSNKNILFLNSAMKARIGHDGFGAKCHEVIHGAQEECSWCLFKEKQLQKHLTHEIISPLDNKSYHATHTPIISPDGSQHVMTVLRDVSQIIEMKENLNRLQHLEALGTLASGISHDFNNILTPILAYSELQLSKTQPGTFMHESSEVVLQAAKRGKDLVKKILAFSQQSQNEKKPTKIQEILNEVIQFCKATMDSSVSIISDIDGNIRPIKVDPIQIHQVSMNLITNAYQAINSKNGEITITLMEQDTTTKSGLNQELPPGKYVILAISDNGHGIERSVVNKIFAPYFTTKEKGTGLGLATSYGIVKDHGGDIDVFSEPKKGTTFTVYFPLSSISDKQEIKEPSKGYEHKRSARILLVDDEPSIVIAYKKMLETIGHEVSERYNGFDALEAFKAKPYYYDLLLTNLTMPGMSGDKLIEKIHQIRPDIPVVLLTGYSENFSDVKQYRGIKNFVIKPVLKEELAIAIDKSLREGARDAKSQGS